MNNRYYSLTFRAAFGEYKFGNRILNADNPCVIGQRKSSDIVLPITDGILPEQFVVILPNENGNGWRIIRRTDYYDVRINNKSLHYVELLHDGDIISLYDEGEYKFIFREHDDTKYDIGNGIQISKTGMSRKAIILWSIMLCFLVLVTSIGVPAIHSYRNDFNEKDIANIDKSVFRINVDSIMLQQCIVDEDFGEYRTVCCIAPDDPSYGTCFFTKDNLCVTARHCVEPWLAYEGWTGDEDLEELPTEVRWAIQAEQGIENQLDTLFRVVALCSVMDGDSCICSFTSDECCIDKSCDEIIHLGEQGLPWRAIFPIYNRMDVELGDYAFVKTSIRGTLELADKDNLKELLSPMQMARLTGFPLENTIKRTMQDAKIMDYAELDGDGRMDQCIRVEVKANEGNSGSPVIVKKYGKIKVVGIMSKKDDHHDGIFFAVPSIEILNFNPVANEEKRYRR